VSFTYKDYTQGGRTREMTLPVEEFMRRFLLHVLPEGFVPIRYYGLLANRSRERNLARCRELLAASSPSAEVAPMNLSFRRPRPARLFSRVWVECVLRASAVES
jgi:putative transposase